jgi:hypothetical protein
MAKEPPENQTTHAERVQRNRHKKPSLKLPPDSKYDWPKDLGELVEWYTHEVEDITRAAQLRIKDATAFVSACANREISLEEAAEQWNAYGSRWGSDTFPGGVDLVRGMTDEEILEAMKKAKDEKLRHSR